MAKSTFRSRFFSKLSRSLNACTKFNSRSLFPTLPQFPDGQDDLTHDLLRFRVSSYDRTKTKPCLLRLCGCCSMLRNLAHLLHCRKSWCRRRSTGNLGCFLKRRRGWAHNLCGQVIWQIGQSPPLWRSALPWLFAGFSYTMVWWWRTEIVRQKRMRPIVGSGHHR